MGKKLAIKGHSTRGKEVIELLKMMGGKICINTNTSVDYAYYIDMANDMIICSNEYAVKHNLDKYQLFTLEEFLEIYPFKIGDEVETLSGNHGKVCAMKWEYDEIKYQLDFGNLTIKGWYTTSELLKYNDNTNEPSKNMEEKDKAKAPDLKGEDYSGKRFGYKIPNGYEFDSIKDNQIIIRPIKAKYPKTYEECCKVLGISYRAQLSYTHPDVEHGNIYLTKEKHLLDAFMKLRICRNAYWKIAGEELGLGKPWEPDYNEESYEQGSPIKYVIYYTGTNITKERKCTPSYILTFPSEEMCDAFYENFKHVIELCKELL